MFLSLDIQQLPIAAVFLGLLNLFSINNHTIEGHLLGKEPTSYNLHKAGLDRSDRSRPPKLINPP